MNFYHNLLHIPPNIVSAEQSVYISKLVVLYGKLPIIACIQAIIDLHLPKGNQMKSNPPSKKLLDQLSDQLRIKHSVASPCGTIHSAPNLPT